MSRGDAALRVQYLTFPSLFQGDQLESAREMRATANAKSKAKTKTTTTRATCGESHGSAARLTGSARVCASCARIARSPSPRGSHVVRASRAAQSACAAACERLALLTRDAKPYNRGGFSSARAPHPAHVERAATRTQVLGADCRAAASTRKRCPPAGSGCSPHAAAAGGTREYSSFSTCNPLETSRRETPLS